MRSVSRIVLALSLALNLLLLVMAVKPERPPVETAATPPIGAPPVDGYDFTVIANPPDGAEPAFECHSDNNERSELGVQCPFGG